MEVTVTHLVGTTFPNSLYGSLTTKPNEVLYLVHEPWIDSVPAISDPNCVVVYRGENRDVRIGCLPRDSEAQKYAIELLDGKEYVKATVSEVKYAVATPEIATEVKNVQGGNNYDAPKLSKMIQSLKTDTSITEAVDNGKVFTFPICVVVSFGDKDVHKVDNHLSYEPSPKGVMCRSITNFLSDPLTQQLYLTAAEIGSMAGFDLAIGKQKKLLLSLTSSEGKAYHSLAGLLLYMWLNTKNKKELLESISCWDNMKNWISLLEQVPSEGKIYIEDEDKVRNTVFNDALKLKGTADVFFVEGKHLTVFDFKRSKAYTSKGEKNTKQYQLQISFYAKELAEKFGCDTYSAKIVLMQLATDLAEPFVTVSLSQEQIDKRYKMIEELSTGKKVI